jgi:hypothetical protein
MLKDDEFHWSVLLTAADLRTAHHGESSNGHQVQRSGIIGEDHLFLQTTRAECTRRAFNRAAGAASTTCQSRRVVKSARWDGLTFDTKGENIIWSSGSQLCPCAEAWRCSPPLADSFILNHKEVAFCAFGTLEKWAIVTPMAVAKKISKFDPKTFLSTLNGGRKIEAFSKKQ